MAERKTIPIENTAQAYLELLRAMGVKYFFGNAGTNFASIIDWSRRTVSRRLRTPTLLHRRPPLRNRFRRHLAGVRPTRLGLNPEPFGQGGRSSS